MCIYFTVLRAHISKCDVHTFHSVMCTTFHIEMCTTFHGVMCTHSTAWCAHISRCDVHTFLSVMCTHFSVWPSHISQCDVHHISHCDVHHISRCDVHTFHSVMCTHFSVMCTHFSVWRAHISQCDVHTFHTTGGFLTVRYWHSSAAVTRTKRVMCGTQQCCRTTWLIYDVQCSTASIFVKFDIRDFITSHLSILMPLSWSVVTGSDESDENTWPAWRFHQCRPTSQLPLSSVKWVCLLSCCAGQQANSLHVALLCFTNVRIFLEPTLMLFMPSVVSLNVHHQDFVISWNKQSFILKMLSDVRNSKVRCASVSATDLHRSPPTNLLLCKGHFEIISAVLSADFSSRAKLQTNRQHSYKILANFYQTARRGAATLPKRWCSPSHVHTACPSAAST